MSSWKNDKLYLPVVTEFKETYPEILGDVDEVECFGVLWKEEDGTTCPVAEDCAISRFCELVWNKVTSEAAGGGIVSIADSAKKRRLRKKRNRGKYKFSSKYKRIPYSPTGRHVDLLAQAFYESVGEPTVVDGLRVDPSETAGLAFRKTKSYHALIWNNIVVARLWVNSVRTAILDFIPDFRNEIKALAVGRSDGMSMPYEVNTKIYLKIKPCSMRVKLVEADAVAACGQVIRSYIDKNCAAQ